MVKNLFFLILAFLFFSCKKENENLHLKYEVSNQLIAEDISEKKNDITEPPPPSSEGIIYLPQEGTFTKDDLEYIKIQIKTNSNSVLDKAKISSKVEFINTGNFRSRKKSMSLQKTIGNNSEKNLAINV